MRTVLVTGGAGFIGSHLCDFLLHQDVKCVIAIDDMSLGKLNNLTACLRDNRFQLYQQDINDIDALNDVFRENNFDTVFHLAANSDIGKSFENPATDLKSTFQTTYNILECMRRYQVKKLVFASTSAIYGEVDKAVDENFGPLLPISHYGAAKLASEAFISSYSSSYNITSYIFRFPNIVGHKATHGIIYDFLLKILNDPNELLVLGNGEQEKPYLHVSDLIDAIFFVINKYSDRVNYYNVAGVDRIKVKVIASIVLEEAKQVRKIRYTGGDRGWMGDVPKFSYNQEKLFATGWKPQYTSEQAIRKAVSDILAFREIKL
jgi:UDP-glucose 4-epimerase